MRKPRGSTFFALVVGIDDYPPPINPLFGCANDVRHLTAFLEGRIGDRLRLATLLDGQATRAAMIDTFRSHLGQAGPGDVAFFSYSGHGSEEPAPAEFAALEASGRIQTLVPVDVGRRGGAPLIRPIADKELAVLIAEVAARGPHVVVVLDCCHSGNGTRDAGATARQWLPDPDAAPERDRNDVRELAKVRPIAEFLAGTVTAPPTRTDHIALSACQSFELAKETVRDGEIRGVFSVALLDTLAAVGPTTTYRSLLAGVRSRVERVVEAQSPTLDPVDVNGPADALVLDGTVQRPDAVFHVTTVAGGFEVDAGSIHGLRPARSGRGVRAGLPGARVRRGRRDSSGSPTSARLASAVEPLGWAPDDIAYDAVIASVPLPAATVRFDAGGLAGGYDAVRRAISVAGPGGTPSAYVRLADDAATTTTSPDDALVAASRRGSRRLHDRDDRGSTDDPERPAPRTGPADPAGRRQPGRGRRAGDRRERGPCAGRTARTHRALGAAQGPRRASVAAARRDPPGDPGRRPGCGRRLRPGPPLHPAAEYRLAYGRRGDAWQAPAMLLSLVNTADRDLFVGVLDLTDRFRCHASLFPTARIEAGHTVAIWDGRPVSAGLPADRPLVSGAQARDWLKVIVSETDFDASAFEMSALDEPFHATRSAACPVRPSSGWRTGS